ncbi:prepilin-type N-terminal cleavage/methylation domain-containing protein [Candidatus Parcubacteria bacterium]|nr:prepilin-type N-terminal cleavage/methylation domain-containing protein [Candidatus Parcubacteria bacterium]
MLKKNNNILNKSGQSMVEIVIALAIFAILAAAFSALLLVSFNLLLRSQQTVRAEGLISEAVAALQSIRNRAYNELIFSRSAISLSGNQWQLMGEGTTGQIDRFTRLIDFFSVYRDLSGEIVASTTPGASLDIQSREASIVINWTTELNKDISIERRICLNNYLSSWWQQSDWQGGDGQDIYAVANQYYSDDGNIEISVGGEISLKVVSTSTYATGGELISSAVNTSARAYSAIIWIEDIPGGCTECDIKIQIKTAPDATGSPGTWSATWCGPDGEDGDESDYFEASNGELIHLDHNGDEWIRYKVILSGSSSQSPTLEEINIYYQ